MLVMYSSVLLLLFSVTNVFTVWLLMEVMFLLFLLHIINIEVKSVGLVVYFFFQSLISLFLFMSILLTLSKLIFLLMMAKLGLFPFFYWMVVVSIKVGYVGNMFVLGFQKLPVFWMSWLILDIEISLMMFLVYLSILYVTLSLVLTSDLWLLVVYSSVANTGLLIFSVYGNYYFYSLLLYLMFLCILIYCVSCISSYFELMLIVFMFLVIPPFILFFMKIYVLYSIDFSLKLVMLIFILDAFVLLYYFSLIFAKFMLMDASAMVYFMNLVCLMVLLVFSNCVTLSFFH